jgi:hypothetical protein
LHGLCRTARQPVYDLHVIESRPDELFPVRLLPFVFDEPWTLQGEQRSLVCAGHGGPPRLATTVSLFHDPERLFVVFDGVDDEVVSTLTAHDSQLYTEDVVEVFLAPETLTSYYEIEISPLGTIFDASVLSPDLDRSTMRVDLSWDPPGLHAATRRVVRPRSDRSWQTVVSIPFADLGRSRPVIGERWRGNFYRIDRSRPGDEFTAWRPTGRCPPDFHVPSAFGTLIFAR